MKPPARYVLDTHALVWACVDEGKIGAKARRVLEAASVKEIGISSIVATALDLGVPLVTKDANITDSGLVETVW
jgi:PIN domain nuclease of toxin-antitoxin system